LQCHTAFNITGAAPGRRSGRRERAGLGSCDLADVNPVEYLADMLPQLARGVRLAEVPRLLPAGSKADRARASSGA
jgi:hypothetical protein